jgi:hypothetical protein
MSRAAHAGESTRFMCNGQAFTVLGNAADPFFVDPDNGMLGQFRHQYFLLCLIAHLHKAALLMLSDRLVVALNRLDIRRRIPSVPSSAAFARPPRSCCDSRIATGSMPYPIKRRHATCSRCGRCI